MGDRNQEDGEREGFFGGGEIVFKLMICIVHFGNTRYDMIPTFYKKALKCPY